MNSVRLRRQLDDEVFAVAQRNLRQRQGVDRRRPRVAYGQLWRRGAARRVL